MLLLILEKSLFLNYDNAAIDRSQVKISRIFVIYLVCIHHIDMY